MTGGFPVANLVAQIVRQITHPLSRKIVRRVKEHQFLERHVLIQLGRAYNWCEEKIQKYSRDNGETPGFPERKKLDDKRIMELGAQMLLEVIAFLFLCGALIYETSKAMERSREIEAKKEREISDLEIQRDQLIERIKEQSIELKHLREFVTEASEEFGLPSPRN